MLHAYQHMQACIQNTTHIASKDEANQAHTHIYILSTKYKLAMFRAIFLKQRQENKRCRHIAVVTDT